MRFVELNTGYSNKPCIDLDRIMSFQWFTEKNSEAEIGVLNILFFGKGETEKIRFKTECLVKDAYEDIYFLVNCKNTKTAKKEFLEKNEQPQ